MLAIPNDKLSDETKNNKYFLSFYLFKSVNNIWVSPFVGLLNSRISLARALKQSDMQSWDKEIRSGKEKIVFIITFQCIALVGEMES
jgi:hypothetical protein